MKYQYLGRPARRTFTMTVFGPIWDLFPGEAEYDDLWEWIV